MNSKILEINTLHFQGNIIDDGWFRHIRTKAGKPYMLAIMILGDIVYWYRPTIYRDEETDRTIFKQKFKADKLQKSYKQFAEKYDVSRDQAKAACDHLIELNLITTEFRMITVNGMRMNNVMYVEPVPEEIKKISISYIALTEKEGSSEKTEEAPLKNQTTLLEKNGGGSSEKTEEAPLKNRRTNTEITTKITTENTTNKKEEDDSPHLPPQNNSLYDQVYAKVVRIYQENIGILPPIYAELFGELLTTMGEELVIEAIKRAIGQNVRKWAYIEKMLVDWKNNQCRTLADVKALDDQQKGGGKNATHRSGYGSYSPASRSYAEEDANRRRSMPSFIKRV